MLRKDAGLFYRLNKFVSDLVQGRVRIVDYSVSENKDDKLELLK